MEPGKQPGNFWAAWVVLLLGMYEIFAPTIWKYTEHIIPVALASVTGGFVFMFAFWVVPTDEVWASWVNVGLGAWLAAASIAFARSATPALVNGIVSGLVIMFFAWLTARHSREAWRRGFEVVQRGQGFLR